MNFYNHHIRSIFKSHSISVTFKFCTVSVALCMLEPRSTDSLGTQHRAKFHALIITTPSIQALYTSSVTGYLVVFVHIADIQQLTEQRLSESDFFMI